MALSIDIKDIKPMLGGLFGNKEDEVQSPAMPPAQPPPQATPAVAGFSEWSSDPKNQEKVVHGITPQGQSVIPANAGITGPPPQPQMASLQGPPALPPPPALDVRPTPPPSQLQTKLQTDQNELRRLQETGSGASQIKNKFGRVAAETGDIAASLLLGGRAAVIPGTTARNYALQDRAQSRVANDRAAVTAQSGAEYKQAQADAAGRKVEIAQQQEDLREQQAANQLERQYAAMGFHQVTGPDGKSSWEEDPNSPITRQRAQKDQLLAAQVDAAKAQTELREATTELKRAGNDVNSPAYQLALKRASIAQQNANAAGLRAKAYWGNYLKGAYNTDLSGNALPGAPIISDDAGNETTVGATNASAATKANSNVAMFNEVDNAIGDIESKAKQLASSGGGLNDARVVAAIADPHSTSAQWAQGQFVNSGLTPAQRDYVTSVKAFKERLQPLRKSAGGGVSDAQVDRLMQLAPGASTPDLDYLMRQTAQIRQLRGNLATGVTRAAGGLKVSGQTKPITGPPNNSQETRIYQGHTYVKGADGWHLQQSSR